MVQSMQATGLRIVLATLIAWPLCLRAQPAGECTQIADDAQRLACYDRLFRAAPPAAAAALPAAAPSAPAAVADRAALRIAEPALPVSRMTSKLWELTAAEKRGTFVVRTYRPNFVLPAHYPSHINRAPSSPTHEAGEPNANYRPLEAKLQVSLRAKVVEGLLLPDADLWFAYTQRSMWQVWNPQDSSPFRSTDYEPEAIYVVPVPQPLGTLPGDWRWRMVQTGIAHQSNGQSDPLSRSWNRAFAGAAFDRGEFGLTVRVNRRFKEKDDDDNPDLTRYIGDTEFSASWLPGQSTAALTWRTRLRNLGRGSVQLDWTYPVDSDQPHGLRWYLQLFNGYGETLLDYNVRQRSIGLGVTLFQL